MLASIPSPPSNGISLGPLFLHAYGLCYGIAVITAVYICARRWRAQGGDPKLVEDCALWGFPAGLIGGRLYHVITSWNEVPHAWWGPFAIWKGGLGIWGGIALGVAPAPERTWSWTSISMSDVGATFARTAYAGSPVSVLENPESA